MKKLLVILFVCFSFSVSAQITRLSPGDNLPTSLGKVNKAIDDVILKAGSSYYLINYGLAADGTTDDGPAIQRCFDAAPTGSVIIFPSGKSIAITTAVYTEKRFAIEGNSSTIVLSTNITGLYFNVKDQCAVRNLNFTGSGRSVALKTEQVGLRFNASVRHILENLRFSDMSGVGLLMVNNFGESANLSQTGSLIDNVFLFNNAIGIALMARSEYNVMTNIAAYENAIAIQDNSGNNTLNGFSFEGNVTAGYKMFVGNNVGHNVIANGVMNHHTTAPGIWSNANGTGINIDNVQFFQTFSKFEAGTKAIVYSGCFFDGSATSGIATFDGSTTTGNIFQNCFFTVAATDPLSKITATNSAKYIVRDMFRADGSTFNWGLHPSTLLAAKTANYTVTSADATYTTKFDCTSGALTASVLAAANMEGQRLYFMKIDASANAMIIDPNGSETIDGSSTSLSITRRWELVTLEGYAGNWIRVDGIPEKAGPGTSGQLLTSGGTGAMTWTTFTGINNTSATDVTMIGTDYNSSGGRYIVREGATTSKRIERALGSGSQSTAGDGADSRGIFETSTLPNNTIIVLKINLAMIKSDGSEAVSIEIKSTWRKDNSGTLTKVSDTAVNSDATLTGVTTLATTNSGAIIQTTVTRTGTSGTFHYGTYLDAITHSY